MLVASLSQLAAAPQLISNVYYCMCIACTTDLEGACCVIKLALSGCIPIVMLTEAALS